MTTAAGKKKRSASSARQSPGQSKSRSVSRSKRPRTRSASASEVGQGPRSARSSPEGEVTPKASRKRARLAVARSEGAAPAAQEERMGGEREERERANSDMEGVELGGVARDGEGDEGEGEGDENAPEPDPNPNPNEERREAPRSPARTRSRTASSRASSVGAPEDFRVRRKRARH